MSDHAVTVGIRGPESHTHSVLPAPRNAAAAATGEVAAVKRLVREVVELQNAHLARENPDEASLSSGFIRVPCLVLLTHLLIRG